MTKTNFKSLSIKFVSLICAIALIASTAVLGGCSGSSSSSETSSKATEAVSESSADENLLSGKINAVIDIKDYGKISLELDADTAPITVTNFVKLAKEGFYDGLTFHRIIKGFMMQGGDPLGTGTGGSDEEIKGEFAQNGVKNDISHVRGVISMARSQLFDSASSQFFIVHEDSTFLDGQYAGFGHVTEGMDIVDKICEETPVIDNNGTVAEGKKPVINTITIED
ncbi:peptidylprolyl isomerase [Ruminococcus sp.]|uniref:peptidylprolyl isomerase n=1 Tax=Ruminococcus sp. TaxID=41978 RepID=UPI0025E0EA67|nr:peptidylprolyl isomerase [Ruminococcus sp.]MCI6615730.1 peptidylprolyl isomerase [Ruminococcus sp.]